MEISRPAAYVKRRILPIYLWVKGDCLRNRLYSSMHDCPTIRDLRPLLRGTLPCTVPAGFTGRRKRILSSWILILEDKYSNKSKVSCFLDSFALLYCLLKRNPARLHSRENIIIISTWRNKKKKWTRWYLEKPVPVHYKLPLKSGILREGKLQHCYTHHPGEKPVSSECCRRVTAGRLS